MALLGRLGGLGFVFTFSWWHGFGVFLQLRLGGGVLCELRNPRSSSLPPQVATPGGYFIQNPDGTTSGTASEQTLTEHSASSSHCMI